MNSEVNKSKVNEVTVKQEYVKVEADLESTREPEKIQFENKDTSELFNTVTTVNTPTHLADSFQLKSDNVKPTAKNLMESAGSPQKSIIQTICHENFTKGSQHQDISVTESSQNNVVKLEHKGFALDQPSILHMKDAILKEPLTEEPPKPNQNKNLEDTDQRDTKKSKSDNTDALSTLATAALSQAPPTKESISNVLTKLPQPAVNVTQEPVWSDVGVIKGTSCLVKQFYSTSITDEHENTSLDNLPDYANKLKIDIEPGTTYKFRVAAINASGRGEWSEVSAFKTCLPGYPDAPNSIKISKTNEGASLKWEAPAESASVTKTIEYTVCMAIKNPIPGTSETKKLTSTNYNFARVYTGPGNSTFVSNQLLKAALIDRTNKPAIIFRIAAKNDKGYGPATQVRWLQDENLFPSAKRVTNRSTGFSKRSK